MKHTFSIEWDHDDAESAQMYIQGREAHLLLWDYDQWLRNELKYNTHTTIKDKWLSMARSKLRELINEYNIRID